MLTKENYFSPENDMRYMSASQFKSFMKCEAAAMAELRGEYEKPKSTALLVGSYVDAHFEGTLDIFKAQHPELFTRSGELKAEYKQAERIIERVERDEMFMRYMSGQKQVIKTGEIAGVPFKIKMDSYHPGKCIVDLKIMRDFEPVYKPNEGRMTFIEAWGYDIQGAIYQAVEGNNLPFYIAAATKEAETDLNIYMIEQGDLDIALDMVTENVPRYQSIKEGKIEPLRCGHCDYCKRTKKITTIITLEELRNE